MVKTVELIALTLEDAKRIEKAGGNRIELISAMSEGGLTPSYGLIEAVVKSVKIPVNVMIRPHSYGFVYTEEEIQLMKQDILQAKKLGANGVVLGVLTPQNEIDVPTLQKLLSVCDGLEVTFHRAIDETDVPKNVKLLSNYPQITTILTSGGLKAPIAQNVDIIKQAIANSGHIDILLGGGLTLENAREIADETHANCLHLGSAVRQGIEIDENKIKQLNTKLGR